MWDLIVSVPDHCLSFYFIKHSIYKSVNSLYVLILFLQNVTLGLKLDHFALLYCCLVTIHVTNNQVNINSVVTFMKPWFIHIT